MEHVMDNQAFNALTTGNKHLAGGNNNVKFFDKAVSPFVGLDAYDEESFKTLHTLLPHDGPILLVTPKQLTIPACFKVLDVIHGLQMIYEGDPVAYNEKDELVDLTDIHIPQMLALTRLTNPGPFAERTIDFGYYKGVFDGDKLVAMAGQRMCPEPYAEISAVCTHPDYTGKGYAKQLLQFHINRIIAAQGIPFLGVRFDNTRAIKVYESIGFVSRTEVYFHALKKNRDL